MLKNILNLKGSKPLSKLQQTEVIGGDLLSYCVRRTLPCSTFDDDLAGWRVNSFGDTVGCCSFNISSS